MWVDLFCSKRTELRSFPSFPALHTSCRYTFLLKTETNTVYSCLSFSLGCATGSVPVEDMDVFFFFNQLTRDMPCGFSSLLLLPYVW